MKVALSQNEKKGEDDNDEEEEQLRPGRLSD